jgi:hypothetical protein
VIVLWWLVARSTWKHSVTVPSAVQGMRASGVAIGLLRLALQTGDTGPNSCPLAARPTPLTADCVTLRLPCLLANQ